MTTRNLPSEVRIWPLVDLKKGFDPKIGAGYYPRPGRANSPYYAMAGKFFFMLDSSHMHSAAG